MTTALVLVAHAPLATALKEVAQHAFPDCATLLQAVDVSPADRLDDVVLKIRSLLSGQDTLILTDVFGATPCNAAMRAAEGGTCRIVCGVNVPMLWRSLCYAAEPLDSLADRAVDGGGQGVLRAAPSRAQNQPAKGRLDDQVNRHDQQ